MESATGCRVGRSIRSAALAAAMVLALAALLLPAPLMAAHRAAPGNDGGACEDCHTLNSADGAQEPGSAYLMYGSRALSNMRAAAAGGQVAKGSYGCVYCHNNATNTEMKGIINHFTLLSRHPMGETFAGFGAARVDTDNKWLSNFAGNTSQATNELDCIDCHEVTLVDDPLNPEVGHVVKTHADRIANPYMLIGVGTPGEYDGFCRTCHGESAGTVKGVNLRLVSHNDGIANAIEESDGTAIKTGASPNKKCSFCHQGHGSTGKKLFLATMDPSNGTKCTDCHENGDANNNFENHGHGMNLSSKNNPLNFSCTGCHGINSAHDPADNTINAGNPKMLDYTEDTLVSVYGKSLRSICKNCHDSAKYTAHTGGNVNVGCIDCHDEHAEGSGAGSNRYMIPQYLPSNGATPEISFFQSSGDSAPGQYDYWVDDANARKTNPIEGAAMNAATNAGICDNSFCHGASTPMNSQPIATFLNTAGKHTGGVITPTDLANGKDCNSCHKHTDSGGSWAANQSCTSCHGQPPVSQATSANGYFFSGTFADEAKTPHARHANSPIALPAVGGPGYGFACTVCHFMNATEPPHKDNLFNSVWFDIAKNPSRADGYPAVGNDYVDGSFTCNNLYCHSDGQTFGAAGSQKDGVTWMLTSTTPDNSASDLSCEACHGSEVVNLSGTVAYGAPDHGNGVTTANSHGKHLYACAVCHSSTTTDTDPTGGWTLLLTVTDNKHVDGVKDLLAGGGYSFDPSAPGASRSCSNISCHGGGTATWGASLSCGSCHDTNGLTVAENAGVLGDGNSTPNEVDNAQFMNTGHGRTTAYVSETGGTNNAGANLSCYSTDPNSPVGGCHQTAAAHVPNSATDPWRLVGGGTNYANTTTATDGLNALCLSAGCHPAGFSTHDSDVTGNAKLHDQKCIDCHDPHGDTNIFMMHGQVATDSSGTDGTGSDAYGMPETTVATSFTAWNPTLNTSDLDNLTGTNQLCEVCHTGTGTVAHNGGAGNPGHSVSYQGQNCISCHTHNGGFKGGACNSCHGGGSNSTTRLNYWPDGLDGTTVKAEDRDRGRHEAHMIDLAARVWGETVNDLLTDSTGTTLGGTKTSAEKQQKLCAYCHPDPFSPAYDPDVTAGDQSFNGVHNKGTVNVGGAYGHQFWDTYSTSFATTDAWTYTAGDANKTYDGSCAGVNCHNGKTTDTAAATVNTGYGWYDTYTTACIMCHTPGGATNDPISGLHDNTPTPTVSGEAHDDSFAGGTYGCITCHSAMPAHTAGATATHINGAFTANDAVANNEYYTMAAYTDGAVNAGTCSGATGPPTGVNTGCHDGAGDAGTWTRKWTTDSYLATGSVSVAASECNGCHGTFAGGWATGSGTDHNLAGLTTTTNHTQCEVCHVYPNAAYGALAPYTTTNHGDGFITMNSNTSVAYNATNNWCTGGVCHAGDATRDMPVDSGWTVEALVGGGASCTSCHGYPPTGASDGGTNWNLHATGTEAVKHDSITSGNTTALKGNHNECGVCHGVSANGTMDGFFVQDPVAINGIYTYVPATDHKDGKVTMNGNTDANTANDAGYNAANGGCDTSACHPTNDNAHQIDPVVLTMPTTSTKQLRDIGKGGCTSCHGGGLAGYSNLNYWPDDGANGIVWENRAGKHTKHVEAIYTAKSTFLTGATATDKKNATCNWCHPGGSHSGDQAASPADIMNGTSTFFKNMAGGLSADGGTDANGAINAVSVYCTNIDCHGGTTPQWYTDTIVPSAVSNLAGTTGTVSGTVNLTWSSPFDDGANSVGIVAGYEVHYSTGAIGTFAACQAASLAGGAPTPLDPGTTQGMTVYNLTPGTSYNFCIISRDEAPNWSALSNVPLVAAKSDTTAPIFGGIVGADGTDLSTMVNLSWNAATDDASYPITYRIWQSATPSINFGLVHNFTTQGLDYQVTGLTAGTTYYFGVRAADAAGTPNVSTNIEELAATPTAPAGPPATGKSYYLRRATTNTTIFAGTTNLITDMNAACGAVSTIAYPGAPVPPAVTGFNDTIPGKQGLLMTTTGVCATSANNYAGSSTGWNTGAWRWGPAFYNNTAYTNAAGTIVKGAATGSNFAFRPGATTDVIRVYFAALTSATSYVVSTNFVAITNPTAASTAYNNVDLSTLQVNVPNNGKFAVLFAWSTVTTTGSRQQVAIDGNNIQRNPVVVVNEARNNSAPPNPTAIGSPVVGTTYTSSPLTVSWTSGGADPEGDTVHYDVYGSADGTNYPYIIATNVAGTSTTWDTVADNIGKTLVNTTVKVKVVACDQYNACSTGYAMLGNCTVNNTSANDVVAPGAITLAAATSITPGAALLTWTATGDDGASGKATSYDIRYSTSAISSDALFGTATQVSGEPAPKTSGSAESFTVGSLTPGTTYYFAIKAGDDKTPTANFGALSNSPSAVTGANCGVCHGMPPTDAATGGSHTAHSSTQADCANCHGNSGTTGAQTYTSAHSNNALELGWKTATPTQIALPKTVSMAITVVQSGTTIYSDANGAGGVDTFTGSDNIDNGTCSGFSALSVGCHYAATPTWGNASTGACGTCHGLTSRTGFLDTTTDPKGAPPNDLAAGATAARVGKHTDHLNLSFNLTGDSCSLCHFNVGRGTAAHGDSTPSGNGLRADVVFNTTYAGAGAAYTRAADPGSCGTLNTTNCHGGTASWSSAATLACSACHDAGAAGAPIVSVAAGSKHIDADGANAVYTAGTCANCHTGHADGITGANDVEISTAPATFGKKYAGHLGKIQIGSAVATGSTEAEICWGCHDRTVNPPAAPKPTEWEDTGDTNDRYVMGKLGTNTSSNWLTGGNWSSSAIIPSTTAAFGYKTGIVQSTHEAISTWVPNAASDKAAAASELGCSVCHNVHNIAAANSYAVATMKDSTNDANKATWGSVVTGTSTTVFLRGSYVQSPYKEDGAPIAGDFLAQTYAEDNGNQVWVSRVASIKAGPGENPNKHLPATLVSWYESANNDSTYDDLVASGPAGGNLNQPGGYHLDDNTFGITGTGYGHGQAVTTTLKGDPKTNTYVNYSTSTTDLCLKCHTLANLNSAWSGHHAVANNDAAATNDIFTVFQGAHQHMNPRAAAEIESRGLSSGNIAWSGFFQWAVNMTGQKVTGTKQKYHNFTCSKCHNPHASRLTYLRINNCLSRSGAGDVAGSFASTGTGTAQTYVNTGNITVTAQLAFINGGGAAVTLVPGPNNAISTTGTEGWHVGRMVHCHNNPQDTTADPNRAYWRAVP